MRKAADKQGRRSYNFVTCNCGDIVKAALDAAGIEFPDTLDPSDTVAYMESSKDWTRVLPREAGQSSAREYRSQQAGSSPQPTKQDCAKAGIRCGSGVDIWE